MRQGVEKRKRGGELNFKKQKARTRGDAKSRERAESRRNNLIGSRKEKERGQVIFKKQKASKRKRGGEANFDKQRASTRGADGES